jgi:membrane associated rhomboid family serine protease
MMQREQWHLTEGLIFAHFAVYLLTSVNEDTREAAFRALALFPGMAGAEPWRLVTYQFLHGGMISFFFSMLVLWIMAKPLEQSWGSGRFLAFWCISVFGAAGTAVLLGVPLYGDIFLSASLLFTFATLYPDKEFLLAFILPVKVKYLAVIGGALLVWNSVQLGLPRGAVNIVGMSAGYLFFLIMRKLPSRRKLAFELNKKKAQVVVQAEAAAAQNRNRTWDPMVRSAAERAAAAGVVAPEDEAFLAELDAARDPSITVCAPSEFGFVEDDVCSGCTGYAECAARRIRMSAEDAARGDS